MFSLDISPSKAMDTLADDDSKWLNLDGTLIHYKDQGKGIPVLMLHNSLMWNGIWDNWIAHMPSELRLIRPDIPGFGLTGPTQKADYSMEKLSSFIGEFLDALNLPSVYIIGFSMGAQLAWRYALKSPMRVKRMVLINPTGYPEKELPDVFKLAQSWKGNILRYTGSRRFLENRIRAMCIQQEGPTSEFFDKLISSHLRKGNRAASLSFMREPTDLRYKQIKTIKTPIQIQWSLSPQKQRFSTDLRNAEFVPLDNMGSFPCLEDPKKCANIASEFITRNGELNND